MTIQCKNIGIGYDCNVPKRCLLLLLRSFASIDVSNVAAVLHAANKHAGQDLFVWHLISEDGKDMTGPDGLTLCVNSDLVEPTHRDIIFVFGGESYKDDASKKVVSWLRKVDRFGAKLVCLAGATGTLAKAGMLDEREVSVHWGQRASIEDEFPEVKVASNIFTMDPSLITCAGGASTLDMMFEFTGKLFDQDLAIGIADRLVCSASRAGTYDQKQSELRRAGIRNEKLGRAMQIIQENIDEPLRPSQIALEVGISTRQLERLFARYLHSTPKAFYMKQRLETARTMLQQTNMRIIDVAVACGFSNQSHFARVYRIRFGVSPQFEKG